MARLHPGLAIPESLNMEHAELLSELEAAKRSGERTGETAERLYEKLLSHFEKEEHLALPILGALREVAEGRIPKEHEEILKLAAKLKPEYGVMLEEHKAISEILEELRRVALAERKAQVAVFADALALHVKVEEEVLYPAAILVGEYIKATKAT